MEAKQVRSLMEAYASVYEEHDNETIVEMDERSPEYNRKKQEEAKAAAHRARTRGGAGGAAGAAARPRTPITAGGGAPEEDGQVDRYRRMAADRARQNQRSGGAGRSVQQNSVDLFDLVKGYLIDEGHAETEEEVAFIMANMTDESREEIIDFIESSCGGGHSKPKKKKKSGY